MADVEQPAAESSQGERKCGMDMGYVKTIDGVLKLKMIGWSFLAFLFCIFAGTSLATIFFGIVVFCGLFLSVGLFIVFAFNKDQKITRINIYLFDLAVSIIGTLAYFIVCMASVFNITSPLLIVAAVFGFIGMFSFGTSIWFNFKRWRSLKPRAKSTEQTYDANY